MTAARAARRHGIATLELVLVFPLLLALVAAIFLVARADTARTFTPTKARNEAWKKRPQADPGDVLKVGHDPIRSGVDGSAEAGVKVLPPYGRTTLTARSGATATAHTWDSRAVPFAPGRKWLAPHTDEYGMIAGNVPILGGASRYLLLTFRAFFWIPVEVVAPIVGPILNGLTIAAGYILYGTEQLFYYSIKLPLDIAITIEEIAETPGRYIWGDSPWLSFMKDVRRVVEISMNVFHNLYDASQGRPGNWTPDDYWWLLRYFYWGG